MKPYKYSKNYKRNAILLIVGCLALWPLLKTGDYQEGITQGIFFILFASVFLFLLLIILIDDFVSWSSKNRRFDFKPVAIGVLTFVSCFVLKNAEDGILFSKPVLKTEIDNPDITGGDLNLYDNRFCAVKRYIEWVNGFKGTYHINNDTLTLERNDLTKVTKGMFTNCYTFNKTKDTLLPCQKGFSKLAVIVTGKRNPERNTYNKTSPFVD